MNTFKLLFCYHISYVFTFLCLLSSSVCLVLTCIFTSLKDCTHNCHLPKQFQPQTPADYWFLLVLHLHVNSRSHGRPVCLWWLENVLRMES